MLRRVLQAQQRTLHSQAQLLINNTFRDSESATVYDVLNPATQEVVNRVPEATPGEVREALEAARAAFPAWSQTAVPTRQRVMLRLQQLIQDNKEELAALVTREQGKTLADAGGDVFRGLEVVEYACGIAPQLMGRHLENVSTGIDTYTLRQPLGVCFGVTPHNFPAMVGLWMWPLAVTCGNTFLLKPSDRVPGATMALADLALQAGLPRGVLGVVHGRQRVVEEVLRGGPGAGPAAVSFVGSSPGGEAVRRLAGPRRVQINMGAKNHVVVMSDADPDTVAAAICGAAFGAAGQRCMALSVAVFVGGFERWREALLSKARSLKVTAGHEAGADLGPLISPQARERAAGIIERSIAAGATCELDGRGVSVEGYGRGNFLGPTVLSDVTPDMEAWREEIFAPVLACLSVPTLDKAIEVVNSSEFGNGTCIFTQSGAAARRFSSAVDVGMVGVNVPIPVPLPYFSFTGWRGSFAGDLPMYGEASVRFYTQEKTVTANWRPPEGQKSPGTTPGLAGVGASS